MVVGDVRLAGLDRAGGWRRWRCTRFRSRRWRSSSAAPRSVSSSRSRSPTSTGRVRHTRTTGAIRGATRSRSPTAWSAPAPPTSTARCGPRPAPRGVAAEGPRRRGGRLCTDRRAASAGDHRGRRARSADRCQPDARADGGRRWSRWRIGVGGLSVVDRRPEPGSDRRRRPVAVDLRLDRRAAHPRRRRGRRPPALGGHGRHDRRREPRGRAPRHERPVDTRTADDGRTTCGSWRWCTP